MLQLHPNDQQFNGLLGVTYMRDLTVALQPITTVNRQTSNINNTLGLCKHDFHILRWISCFHNNALYKGTSKTCVADYVWAQLKWLDTNCHSSVSPTTNAWPTLRYVGRNDAITKPFCGQEVCVKACLTSMTPLTHWGRVTHICVRDLTSIGSDNGLSPGRRQAIIRTSAGILLIRPLGTNFSEFLVEILIFSFKKMRLKVSSAKWRPFCLGLNVLNVWVSRVHNTIRTVYKVIEPYLEWLPSQIIISSLW